MGNCPPLPCPSPCPDLSFQDICANNNCHGCCIFHGCCNSKPSVPDEAPAWDSPPLQLSHLPAQPGLAAKAPVTTARGGGGVAQDAPANRYRFRPSPWGTESGLVPTGATERDNGSGVAPPGVPPAGNVDRPGPSSVPWLAWSALAETAVTGHDAGGVPSNGDRRAPSSSWSGESGSAETACATGRDDGKGVSRDRGQPVQPARRAESGLAETWATGRDAGALAPEMPSAAPQVVPGNEGPPLPSLSRRAGSDLARTWATDRDSGSVPVPRPRHRDRRALPPPYRRTESSSAEAAWATGRDDCRDVARSRGQPVPSVRRALSDVAETWATGRDAGPAAPDMPLAVAVESAQDSSRRRDSSSPAPLPTWRSREPQGRLLWSPSLPLSAGRLSPAESRRRFPQDSGEEDMT
ncbi:hypothetical protein SEVIR_2G176400v4 [Setaria viridis]|uniref:Uncharacterized protein n=1 Tax=Setaria viridis TaxID=4556 RepID=A0A4U6VUA1_SETVI|nr:hypothetical protein SEVIR_2G176400v2 [Setaria viridis]